MEETNLFALPKESKEPRFFLTKDFILKSVSQEQIFSHYGIEVKKGLFVAPSFIRKDHKPTCSFYKNNKGELIFKDFGSDVSGNCFSIVMRMFDCSYYQALKIVANDFNLMQFTEYVKNPKQIIYSGEEFKQTTKANIQVEIQNFTEEQYKWWEDFGISKLTLEKFKVFSIKSIFLNGNYFIGSTNEKFDAIYGYYGGKDVEEFELWRLYMPHKKTFRFLSNWPSSCLQGQKQLPRESNHLFITKSLKDVMRLYELGIVAIAPTSETVLISKDQYRRLKIKYQSVLLFFDNDLAGVKAAKRYKKEFPEIKCIFLKRKWGKDISDFYKANELLRSVEAGQELQEIIKDSSIRKTNYFYIL